MSFFNILGKIFIGPLKLLFEIIFQLANSFVGHPGLSIIFLSLIMNILVLPLYKRADAMQEESRDNEARLQKGVSHIKKVFSGDEKMMIMQTYYRQNNYKPTDALKGSVSLLLEIPFFMAAYQFLSNLDLLNGVSLGPIKDLGAPDGMLVIGSVAINLLPVIMTLINVISSALYLKGFPLKTKIQLYGMALFFLVFLYTSPAGLVFYWTLNNLFSLVKTIFYKIKNPGKVLSILTALLGIGFVAFGGFVYTTPSLKKKLFICGIGVILLIPFVVTFLIKKKNTSTAIKEATPNKKLFFLASLFLTILVGLLIPSVFISASPKEYVDITYFHNPLWYIVSTAALAAGTFLVWFRVFYWLATPKGKVIFEKAAWILCGAMLVNYMFFGTDLGIISSNLQYERGVYFTLTQQLINILALFALAAVLYFIISKWNRACTAILTVAVIALGAMSAVNMFTIKKSVDEISSAPPAKAPEFNLDKNANNVMVIMLDRGLGHYVPYIFNEKPELKEQFDGFTYYSNTISHGGYTNFGVPGLLGGYEYTPVEMNKRDSQSLVSKHNEALKLMPAIFSDAGYDVTVCDPPYANYEWIPDLTIFDDYPEIDTYITKGLFSDPASKEQAIVNNHRNFFCFGIMKTMPLCLQSTIYNNGNYHRSFSPKEINYSTQTRDSLSTAKGLSKDFMDPYNVLLNLPDITKITEDKESTYLFIANDTTHEPMLLQAPDYTPEVVVDNTAFDANNLYKTTAEGNRIEITQDYHVVHYQSNAAALIQLGKYFDYLRENGVYDNTRIIIASDHGTDLFQINELTLDSGISMERYFPLLMVKDFNSTGFTTSNEFMTSADVPTLATKDIIENPTNPFTGKAINNSEKTAHDQFIILSHQWDVEENNKNTFLPSPWLGIKNNIWDKNNITYYTNKVALSQHKAP